MPDTRYLEWHGNQWRVRVKVSAKARLIIGKAHLVRPLHTDSLAEANRRKHRVVADLKDEIAKAEKLGQTHDPLAEEALTWRAEIAREELEEDGPDGHRPNSDYLPVRVEEIERRYGEAVAQTFHGVATGLRTPIDTYIEAWLAERSSMKPRQVIDYRRAVRKFVKWREAQGLSAAIEGTDLKLAGVYLNKAMVAAGVPARTANKDLSALRVYWKWLIARGHAATNPWRGISMEKPKARSDDERPKRPYYDPEIVTLFQGINEQPVLDAITIAALMGLRVEEIARLQVRNCHSAAQGAAEDFIHIQGAKSAAGNRSVPIHPLVAPIIARRVHGKGPTGWLFDELPEIPASSARERGQPITKRFVVLRRNLGVDERLPGARQSRIDFHSFRRWFAKKAREALQQGARGYDTETISEVVGHDVGSSEAPTAMTIGVYAGPAALAARRACIDAVQLPPAALEALRRVTE